MNCIITPDGKKAINKAYPIPIWGTEKNRENARKEVRALIDSVYAIMKKKIHADAVKVARKLK